MGGNPLLVPCAMQVREKSTKRKMKVGRGRQLNKMLRVLLVENPPRRLGTPRKNKPYVPFKKPREDTEAEKHSRLQLGQRGEAIEVKKGFARNFLLPFGYCVRDTPANRDTLGTDNLVIDYEARDRERRLELAKKRIAKVTVQMKRQQMPDGDMHAPVRAEQIRRSLMRQHQLELNVSDILLPEPLNRCGEHAVRVRFPDFVGQLTVTINKR